MAAPASQETQMPLLKALIDKLDDVEEAARPFYAEKGGKFELQVEGGKTQADIDRVNVGLTKERADHVKTQAELKTIKENLAKFDGLDPEQVHAKLGEYDTLKATANGKPDAGAIEALVKTRVEQQLRQQTAPLERKLAEANTKLDASERALGETKTVLTQRQIDDVVRQEALSAKADPRAINDLLTLSRTEITIG